MLYNEEFDALIEKALKEELENIDIDYEEVEKEWKKLQIKRQYTNRYRYKNITAVVAVVLILLFVIPLTNNQVYSWKMFNIFDIYNNNNNKVISETSSTNKIIVNKDSTKRQTTLSDARDIIEFDFKTLSFELQDISVFGRKKIILNYTTEKGTLSFIQNIDGVESSKTINVLSDSDINIFNNNHIVYNYINIKNKATKIIWNNNGVNSTLNIKYYISLDDAKQLIKSLK